MKTLENRKALLNVDLPDLDGVYLDAGSECEISGNGTFPGWDATQFFVLKHGDREIHALRSQFNLIPEKAS